MKYLYQDKLNIPDCTLYTKKQILDEFGDVEYSDYYSLYTGKKYRAFVKDGICVAKQYPEKDLFYKILSTPIITGKALETDLILD